MNQRFQNAEIRLVSEQYADNELYHAVSSIGQQLEAELTGFGLCPEECFMEVLELLSAVNNENDFVSDIENTWLRKYNEYKRFNRVENGNANEDEIRKAVGIVFAFAVLAIDSSRHRFYRYTLAEQMMSTITAHKFDGWTATLQTIFSVPLTDGWFDNYIDEEPENGGEMAELAKNIDTLRKQVHGSNIIIQLVNKQYNEGCQQFMGKMEHPKFITPQQNEAER